MRQRLTADERRRQLVAATVAVIADGGFQAGTAEAIARQAGVSKGLLWHYFTDLDDLLESTARGTLVVLRDVVVAQLDLSAPAPDIVRAAVRAAVRLRETHGTERRAINEIVFNLRDATGGLRFSLRDYEQNYAGQETLIFRRGQAEGQLRPELDARALAVTYQSAVDGMLDYLDAYPETDAAAHADTVADILLGGMVKQPGGAARPVRPANGRPAPEIDELT